MLDKFPALLYTGKLGGLIAGRQVSTDRPVLRTILQNISNELFVRESEDVVKIFLSVLGIAAGMGAAEDRDRSPGSKQVA